MSKTRPLHVLVPTFISPTLFWVIDTCRILEREDLEEELLQVTLKAADPIAGELVAVQDGNKVKRAEIISIETATKKDNYTCWLIDHGVAIFTDCVYELNQKHKSLPAIAMRASLMDVVYIQTELDADDNKFNFVQRVDATKGARLVALERMKEASDVFFKTLKEQNGIIFGDLIVLKDHKHFSLTEELINNEILAKNEALFWNGVQERNQNSEIILFYTRSVSRSSCSSDFSSVKYDTKAHTYVIDGSFKNLGDELCSDESCSVGRGRRATTTTERKPGALANNVEQKISPPAKSVLNKLLQCQANSMKNHAQLSNVLPDGGFHRKGNEDAPKSLSKTLNAEIKETDFCDNNSLPSIEESESSTTNTKQLHLNFLPEGCQQIHKKKKVKNIVKTPLKQINPTSQGNYLFSKKFSTSSSKSSSSSDCKKGIKQNDVKVEKKCNPSSDTTSSDEEPLLNLQNNHKKILGCSCDSCKFWDTTDVKESQEKTFTDLEDTSIHKQIIKPPLLLKTGTAEEEGVEIKTLQMLGKKMNLPPLVVHGVVIPSPNLEVLNVPFHENIHHCLTKYGFQQAKKIQLYVWPAIMRNLNVCYVNSAKSGKTMAYVPAIYSFLLEEDRYSGFSSMMSGPLAVIVCEGNRKAENVYDVILRMKAAIRRDKVDAVLALLPISTFLARQLSQKHSLLITTLPTLIFLLQHRKLSLKRMCHIIFEDADLLLQKYSDHFNSLLRLSQEILEHRSCSLPVQMILSSEQWTNRVNELLKQLKAPPLVCIGAYLEAAIYGKVNIKMHFIESKLRQSTLVDILTHDNNCYNKCIIICNSDEELEEASFLFPNRSIKSIIIKSSLSQNEITTREHLWNSSLQGAYPVLLCTDDVFNKNLSVTDATLLVHYSLPTSWTHFSQRFSCFVDNYTSPLNTVSADETLCKSFIFVDETCQLQFPRLIAFLQRMNVPLPNSFIQHCQMVKEQDEMLKVKQGVKLCDTLRMLGSCNDEKCRKRHMLSKDLDYGSKIDGYVKFEILAVHDVALYYARIIEYASNGKIVKTTVDDTKIEQDLSDALSIKKEIAEEINIGDWFVVLDTDDETYKRCEVLKIGNNATVKVFYLDDGRTGTVTKASLCKLPEKFKIIPAQATLIYFANMVPPETDTNFSSHSIQLVETILRNAEDKFDTKIYKGKTRLSLSGNMLWLDNIVLTSKVKDSEVTVLYLKEKLIKNKLADYDANALENLLDLCKKVEIPFPEYKFENGIKRRKKKCIRPRYAFLEEDDSCNEVYFKAGNSPSEFFICLKKFHILVERLERDIKKEITKSSYQLESSVELNHYYLALDETEDKYCRVRVTAIDNNQVDCFFVDYGDQQLVKIDNLKKLPGKFISVLPFQAIECRLFGVSPILDCWCPEATDVLYDYCFEPNSDYFRTLYAVVMTKEQAKFTNGEKYSILLLDNLSGATISISNLLIDCGFASFKENEELPANFPEIVENHEQSSESELEEQQQEIWEQKENDEMLGDDWDLQVFNPLLLLSGEDVDVAKKLVLCETKEKREVQQPLKALPLFQYRTPTVVWHQTDVHIKLDIQIPNVTDYVAKLLRDRVFVFRTNQAETPYHLSLQLYGKVEKTFQHSAGGLSVKICLSKCRKEEWPRLTIQHNVKNVKYNMDMYQNAEEEEDNGRKFLTLSKDLDERILGETEKEVCIGSDFDENSDSDMELSD